MNDPKNTSTDPAIEQEAERMLSELEKLCVRGRGPLYSSGSTVEILRSDMFGLLRELATLRRGAAACPVRIPDSVTAPNAAEQ